ncbi:MAG: hypothetical protein M1834_008345 [Cirrosporium novae-zelandiae]|nr:MAG: hypothetical protein M1834_008345 [Cirrosporium novae-zelandiae]
MPQQSQLGDNQESHAASSPSKYALPIRPKPLSSLQSLHEISELPRELPKLPIEAVPVYPASSVASSSEARTCQTNGLERTKKQAVITRDNEKSGSGEIIVPWHTAKGLVNSRLENESSSTSNSMPAAPRASRIDTTKLPLYSHLTLPVKDELIRLLHKAFPISYCSFLGAVLDEAGLTGTLVPSKENEGAEKEALLQHWYLRHQRRDREIAQLEAEVAALRDEVGMDTFGIEDMSLEPTGSMDNDNKGTAEAGNLDEWYQK